MLLHGIKLWVDRKGTSTYQFEVTGCPAHANGGVKDTDTEVLRDRRSVRVLWQGSQVLNSVHSSALVLFCCTVSKERVIFENEVVDYHVDR